MQSTTLILLLGFMAIAAFYFGRGRSLSLVGGPGHGMALHSLPGYYGYFTLDDVNGLQVHQESDQSYTKPFLYTYTGPRAELLKLLNEFQDQYGNGGALTIELKHHL